MSSLVFTSAGESPRCKDRGMYLREVFKSPEQVAVLDRIQAGGIQCRKVLEGAWILAGREGLSEETLWSALEWYAKECLNLNPLVGRDYLTPIYARGTGVFFTWWFGDRKLEVVTWPGLGRLVSHGEQIPMPWKELPEGAFASHWAWLLEASNLSQGDQFAVTDLFGVAKSLSPGGNPNLPGTPQR